MPFYRLCLIWLLILSANVYCWGPTGHRIIALHAQNHMAPNTLKWIEEHTGVRSLAWEANWADEIKSDFKLKQNRSWHYAHYPDLGHSKQIITAISYNKKVLLDSQSTKAQKKEALRWLIHLVGDLHQPLHVTGKKEAGFNGCMVKFLYPKKVVGLHALWDSHIINQQNISFTEWQQWLDEQPVKVEYLDSPEKWADESYIISRQILPKQKTELYCKLSKNDRISLKDMPMINRKYIYENMPILNSQLYKAGIRLAHLFDMIADLSQ